MDVRSVDLLVAQTADLTVVQLVGQLAVQSVYLWAVLWVDLSVAQRVAQTADLWAGRLADQLGRR